MIDAVMKFGVRRFLAGGDAVIGESERAHRYYNERIEILRKQREKRRAIMRRYVPELTEVDAKAERIDAEIKALYAEVKDANRKASAPTMEREARRTRVALSADQQARLKGLREEQQTTTARRQALDAHFDALIAPAKAEYDRRASGAPAELIEQIAEIGARIKAAKKVKSNPEVAVLKRALDDLKKRKAAIAPKTHQKRAANLATREAMLAEKKWPQAWKDLEELNAATDALEKAAYAKWAVTDGTYASLNDAVGAAVRTSGFDLRFARWEGGRKVGKDLKKLPAAAVLSKASESRQCSDRPPADHHMLRITDIREPEGRRSNPVPRQRGSNKSRHRYCTVSFPIGVKEQREWVSAEVYMHRQIPEGAILKSVYLVPKKVGFRTTWSLQFVVGLDRPLVERATGKGTCEVKIRWSLRKLDPQNPRLDRLVVAEVNGKPFELDGEEFIAGRIQAARAAARAQGRTLSADEAKQLRERGGALAAIRQARALHGVADGAFDLVRRQLKEWAQTRPAQSWIRKEIGAKRETATARGQADIMLWRNHGRLAWVAREWVKRTMGQDRANELWVAWMAARDKAGADYFANDPADVLRFVAKTSQSLQGADEAAMAFWLEVWRRKDAHLVQWAADADRKGRNCRKDQYRAMAARLATTFERVTMQAVDLQQASAKAKLDESALGQESRAQKAIAAPSEFVEALKHVFGKERFAKASESERSGGAKPPGGARRAEILLPEAAE